MKLLRSEVFAIAKVKFAAASEVFEHGSKVVVKTDRLDNWVRQTKKWTAKEVVSFRDSSLRSE